MAQIQLWYEIRQTDILGADNPLIPMTRVSTTYTEAQVKDFVIDANQTMTIWDPTLSGAVDSPADFDLLILIADGALDVEFITNEGDSSGAPNSVRLAANIPLILGADDSYDNGERAQGASAAITFTPANIDVIDKIRVDEPAGAARTLKMIICT